MRVFSVTDVRDVYWEVGLTEELSYLTVFHTSWGRKRFRRMSFGICSANKVMQKRNETVFGDIEDVYVIADDIIVATKNEKEHEKSCSHYSTEPKRRAFASIEIRHNLK